ncbi:2-polyprenyl-3-methyl-5-hydroxy-6-metoxy-1,4-benzoquinol methylase [Inhella inkyongensis]|uniref:2-polyprenyl-3-methyl-5-hydroxy-6-metoxy-1, 4-benzoquinol methylase n=1 Tax=Inhella inkyongensis TaxID=392593 RepID=A0A840S7Q9_9BURK|nr:class I SAM-dependent methyltransferase [Inhella inkyongensis]MBB5204480.1 2-polyprenyl-3-methyl-5-hydroxy-6-metoxy-1,4-benzoquinol methylase [Inhella inkyongensis]
MVGAYAIHPFRSNLMLNNEIVLDTPEYVGYYQKARYELLNLAANTCPQRILEIGCGAGANLSEAKKRWPSCHTVGVEARADAAAIAASCLDRVILADVRLLPNEAFAAAGFDLIILSHVLEHFEDPSAILAKSLNWLGPNGQLLVALPNVRHASVLVDLVFHGEFRYRSSGILDQTHLRFFTRRSAQRMLEQAGFELMQVVPEFGGNKSKALNRWTLGLAEEFAAYAYNFRLARA